MVTAEKILSYGKSDASRFFAGSKDDIRKKFRDLAKTWHPDRSGDPRAAEVFNRIMELRDRALQSGGASVSECDVGFTQKNGKPFRARVIASTATDSGKVHISSRTISFEYEPGLEDIASIERTRVEGFRFADQKMREQMAASLPSLASHADLHGGGALNIFARPTSEVLLADFIETFGAMPDVHAAWLGSGLLNIACYLQWAGLVHGAIGLDSVMVDPETHSVRLVGGWGFSVKAGERPVMLPNRTLDLFPAMAVKGKVATHDIDLNLIRRTMREALGDPAGTRLKSMGVPAPIVSFLTLPPEKTALDDYVKWQKALVDAWGPRRFIKFNGRAADVYKV